MKRSPLKTYEGQIKVVLVLLVLFLAVAIYCNVHLLVIARNAIQDEAGRRLALEADLVRVELERDQMLRGLRSGPEEIPYIPPTYLDRIARLKGMASVEILSIDGRVLSASEAAKVGSRDALTADPEGRAHRTLMIGRSVITGVDRPSGSPRSTLAAYRPIRDRRRQTIAFIRVEQEMPVLFGVDRRRSQSARHRHVAGGRPGLPPGAGDPLRPLAAATLPAPVERRGAGPGQPAGLERRRPA
jgi:hypothetical protein